MKIVVTGGLGFIGSNLILEISNDPTYEIIIVDNCVSKSSNLSFLPSNVSIHSFDLCDTNRLTQILHGADLVLHLAAMGNVVQSIDNPLLNFQANVVSTLSVLEAMRSAKVRNIIFSSTGGALMGNTPPPVDEKSVPKPISPYGASKLSCEGYISAYCNSYEINSVILRFGNVYGPYCLHKVGVVNKWFAAMNSGSDIAIYGDGSSSRDYIFSRDIVHGIILAINHLFDNSNHSNRAYTFHLANSIEVSLISLYSIMSDLMDYQKEPIFLPSRPGEVYRNFSLSSSAEVSLGFKPSFSFLLVCS